MSFRQGDPKLDYNGSRRDASRGWPLLRFPSEVGAALAHFEAWHDVKVPYGSCVLAGCDLHLETLEQANAVYEHLRRLGISVKFDLSGSGYQGDLLPEKTKEGRE